MVRGATVLWRSRPDGWAAHDRLSAPPGLRRNSTWLVAVAVDDSHIAAVAGDHPAAIQNVQSAELRQSWTPGPGVDEVTATLNTAVAMGIHNRTL